MAEPQNLSGLTITRLGGGTDTESIYFLNSIMANVVFNNVITPNFSEQMVYGRNEPLVVYKNTTRTINFSFAVASTGSTMAAINTLQSMVYSSYDNIGLVTGTPIFKIRYNNLIYDPYTRDGLIGIVKDFNVGEKFEYGKILMGDAAIGGTGVTAVDALTAYTDNTLGVITYASMKVAFNFIPLPSQPIGYNATGFSIPYNNYPFKRKA
jgi:hypothetical protein